MSLRSYDDFKLASPPECRVEMLPCERCKVLTDPDNLHLGICSECGTSPTICRRCNEPCWLRDLNDLGMCCEPTPMSVEEEISP